jgi:hypothetical protein
VRLFPAGGRLRELWDPELVASVRSAPGVVRVVCIGTVFAAELSATSDGSGYRSNAARGVVKRLRAHGASLLIAARVRRADAARVRRVCPAARQRDLPDGHAYDATRGVLEIAAGLVDGVAEQWRTDR